MFEKILLMSVRIDDPQIFLTTSSTMSSSSSKDVSANDGDESTGNVEERADSAADEQQKNSSPPSPEAPNINVFDLELQQKAIQRLTSTLGLSNLRTPALNLPPIFQALQHGAPFNLQQQLLGLASGLSAVSPGDDEYDEENANNGEPEDLTLAFRKDAKSTDEPSENSGINSSGGPGWSYEEQFKQLYELSDDVKRKEWLDDWLNFMHRIGKPVTRIPIMAKQVLDLYELYRLVVQHGGLVEIINKKLWREITKGLNLPSSITSAAFTLRTQYQKYLYDYECDKERLSNPADLQQAIDGNRREAPGRRTAPSFPLPFSLPHASAANILNKQLNGLAMRHDFSDLLDDENSLGLQAGNLFASTYGAEQMALLEAHQRQMERAQRAAEAVARQSLGLGSYSNGNQASGRESTSSMDSEIPAKRQRTETTHTEKASHSTNSSSGFASSLKISTKNSDDSKNSMQVSMEINGITYQGVLFAARLEKAET